MTDDLRWIDVAGVHGPAEHRVRVPLAAGCTTIVGPNATGKSDLLGALAAQLGPGVLHVEASSAPSDLLTRASQAGGLDEALLAEVVLDEVREVVPEVDHVEVAATDDGPGLRLLGREGRPFTMSSGLRASVALGLGRMLAHAGRGPTAILVEEPAAFLHPVAQEALRDRLTTVAADLGIPVVLSSESTFVIPRGADDLVVAIGRDVEGHLTVLGHARGDDRHADLVGGLFRDPGLAVVLDRAATFGPDTRAVLVVEGGTDEAYLEIAARHLRRAEDLDGLAIVAAGGASAAALQAVVLRAETALPLLVLLDNDENGRRARDTLVKRLSFEKRREAMTYAELLPGYPDGTEAEDLFADHFVGRFVDEMGPQSITGQRELWRDVVHYDLTSWAKSAFVSWADQHATPADLDGWHRLLDVLVERLGLGGDVAEPPA